MNALQGLIDDAVALANPDDTMHGGRLWRSEGGRACPIGWDHCSQPVFVDIRTGETDYGERGGPGYASCKASCPEGMQPPPDDEDETDTFTCHDCGHGWSAIDETERPRQECPVCGGHNTDVPPAAL